MILPYKLCPLEFYRNVDCLVEEFKLGPNAIGLYTDRSSFNVGHVGPMMGKQGHVITIDGEGFGMDVGSVYFGSNSAQVISWKKYQIKVVVPGIEAGNYSITVQDAKGVLRVQPTYV